MGYDHESVRQEEVRLGFKEMMLTVLYVYLSIGLVATAVIWLDCMFVADKLKFSWCGRRVYGFKATLMFVVLLTLVFLFWPLLPLTLNKK